MAEIVFFHHALGLTDGCRSLARRLGEGGHLVHTPDLYEGKTFTELADGLAYAKEVGFGTLMERGKIAAEGLPNGLVYAGFSLGVVPAQMLAQTRPGAKGAVFVSSAIPPTEFGDEWPAGVPLQIHMMESDPIVVDEGDLDVARQMVSAVSGAELFLYPGDGHFFADDSVPGFDEEATALLTHRVEEFLSRVE
jgi:dienelactone hydrolase